MISEKVKKMVAEQLCVPIEKVKDNAKFVEDLGADSLDLVEMLTALEDEFGIRISDEEALKMTTIAEAIKVVESKQKK